jgi:hypothetical protein
MSIDRASTPSQGRAAFERAITIGFARAAVELLDSLDVLSPGLCRVSESARIRAKLKLKEFRPLLDSINADRVRVNAGISCD